MNSMKSFKIDHLNRGGIKSKFLYESMEFNENFAQTTHLQFPLSSKYRSNLLVSNVS